MVYSNTAVYGESEYGKSGRLSIFTLLKALIDAFEGQFCQGFSSYTLSKTLIWHVGRAIAALICLFFVETLLGGGGNIIKECL